MDSKKLAKMRAADVAIERSGTKVVLPEGGDLEQLGMMIAKIGAAEKEPVNVDVLIEGFPYTEALVAVYSALCERFGWMHAQGTPGFFGNNPPEFVEIQVNNLGETVSVPVGSFGIPGLDGGKMSLSWRPTASGPCLRVTAQVRKRDLPAVRAAIQEAKASLETSPLYRGCAIRLRYPDMDEVQDVREFEPEFLRIGDANPDDLIFSRELANEIEAEVFGPVRYADAYLREGESLKVGVLLSGPPGVGKTMVSRVLASLCVKHGQTFVLSDVAHLVEDLKFGKKHGPCVIFAEDIDQVFRHMEPGERNVLTDAIFNELDGVDSKDKAVRLVATTNSPELLSGPLCRPGRFDVVIPIDAPDADAAERLLRRYAGNRLAVNESVSDVANRLAGQQPAVVEAIARRAIRFAIYRQQGGGEVMLTQRDLLDAWHLFARSKQQALMAAPKVDRRQPIEKAAAIVAGALRDVGYTRRPFGQTPEAAEIEESLVEMDYAIS